LINARTCATCLIKETVSTVSPEIPGKPLKRFFILRLLPGTGLKPGVNKKDFEVNVLERDIDTFF
jgi:hypothetical protein